MEFTLLFAKIVGPLLLLRGVSILLDRQHFLEMLENIDSEVKTVSFSFFPIALFIACATIALTQHDTSSLAGLLVSVIAWMGMLKAAMLMLFPRLVAVKARALGKMGFINVVTVGSFIVGAYFTWFGFLAVHS